jgi:hypothetical protein
MPIQSFMYNWKEYYGIRHGEKLRWKSQYTLVDASIIHSLFSDLFSDLKLIIFEKLVYNVKKFQKMVENEKR